VAHQLETELRCRQSVWFGVRMLLGRMTRAAKKRHSRGEAAFTWRSGDLICVFLLACAVAFLFETSPTRGDFWWSDAPRHAMDGVFYYDLVRSMPIGHLKRWAMDYYLQYPAITVLTYPPLFAVVEAACFAAFGISNATAQLTVSLFFLATAWGAYFLVRRWLQPMVAFAMVLVFIGAPVMVLWGRQVMLEVPTFAFLLWSVFFFFKYLDSEMPRHLYVAVILVVTAAYTKQPALFIIPAYLATLVLVYRVSLFRRREMWWSSILFAVGLVPLVAYTWLWGRANMQQAVGGGWVKHSRVSPATWSYVARFEWPHQLGWGVLALAVVYCVGCLLRKEWRLKQPGLFFVLAWLVTGYAFFTLIAVSSQRYTIFLIFPLVLFAMLAIINIIPRNVAPYAALVFGVVSFIYTLATNHVPYVSGYKAAAQYVCSVAPPDSVVMFSGLRDGSFIFNVKSTPGCKNITVVRADKLLLRVAIDRHLFGVQDFGVSETRFKNMLERYSVHYIVIEPNFWSDLKSMQMLLSVLHQDQFRLLTKIPVASNRERIRYNLEIYENTGPLSQTKNSLRVELPGSGIAVQGAVGQNR